MSPSPAVLAVVAAYLAVTFALGYWATRRAKQSSKDFFIAERTLPWWVIGLNVVAAGISAEQMLGEVAYAKDAGLVVSNWDLGVYPSLVLMVLLFLPLYLRSGVTTIPEYLDRRYGPSTRFCFAAYSILNNACVVLVVVMTLGSVALNQFLGIPPAWAAAGLAIFTGLYTVYGGMASVAWTETFQCVLLLAGGLLVFGVSLSHVPGGWEGLMDRMAQDRLDHLVRPVSDAVIPWPGLLLLALSTNVWYCCTNQFYVQSCLGAKNEWHGRMGILLTAFLGPVLTLCCAFPGYIARDLLKLGLIPPIPDDNANNTYPHLARVMLGNGALQGFLVAAVVGAVMSSISAIVNATASMVTLDVYKRWVRPDANDRRLVQVGRWAGAATLAVAYPICLYVMDRRYIFTYSQNAWCILSIPIMWVFAMGMLWKRATTAAANATFLACLPFLAVPFVWGNEIDSWVDAPWLAGLSGVLVPASWYVEGKLHLFNVAFVLWVAAAVFMAAASLLTKAPDPAAVAPYVWNRSLLKPPAGETPAVWWKSVGFWSVVAAGMYAAVYVAYW